MVATAPLPELPAGLVELLCDGPSVRPHRIAEVTRRLAAGEHWGADEVAAAVVASVVVDARALHDLET